MRNIKTAISVFLCIVILKTFFNTSPIYACIAAVITMQSTVHDSFTTGKNRMVGTIIGAICGLMFTFTSPGNPFLTSIGIVFVIYLLNVLSKTNSINIACVVFLSIMTNLKQGNPLMDSFDRVLETFVGIFVSVLINYLIFPPKYLDNLNKQSKLLVDNIFLISKQVFDLDLNINLPDLNAQISKLEKSLDSYSSEIQVETSNNHHILKINKLIDISKTAYNHLVILNSLALSDPLRNCYFNEKNNTVKNELFNENKITCFYISNDITIVFNYHTENLLKILTNLKTTY